MATSGIIMILYLIAHMIGNLHAFQGAEAYNDYSTWLRTFGEAGAARRTLLTAIEIVLVVVGPRPHVGRVLALAPGEAGAAGGLRDEEGRRRRPTPGGPCAGAV